MTTANVQMHPGMFPPSIRWVVEGVLNARENEPWT